MNLARRALASATVVLALATAGCATDDEPTTTPTTAGTESTEATAAASPTSEPAADATTAPATDGRFTLTQDQVTAALMTGSDVGDGWAVGIGGGPLITTSPADFSNSYFDPDTCTDLPVTFDSFSVEATGVHGVTQVVSAAGDAGIGEQIQVIEGLPSDRYAALESLVAACPSFFQVGADGDEMAFSAATLDLPELGDATLGVRVTQSTGEQDVAMYLTLTSIGDVEVALVGVYTDDATMIAATQAAVDRVRAAA